MTLNKRYFWLAALSAALLMGIAALVYLPNLSQATILRDDWYYTLDRLMGGPGAFQQMFAIDRPARGPFFEGYYRLFGIEPGPYHAASLILRLLAGLGTLWLVRLWWPGRGPAQRWAGFAMALLFVIYPGYTRWMEGFEDQPNAAALLLMVLSLALTFQALRARRPAAKIALWVGAMVTGWGMLALIEYFIGVEVLRWLGVLMLEKRARGGPASLRGWLGLLGASIRSAAPALLIPGAFLVWRLLIFSSARPETDLGLQLSAVAGSPVVKGAWWLIHLAQSLVNSLLLAWSAPSLPELFGLRLKEAALGLGFAVLAGGLAALAAWVLLRPAQAAEEVAVTDRSKTTWPGEAIVLGLLGAAAGVLPIVITNRSASFGAYSHYTLPAALPAALFIVGVVGRLRGQTARIIALALLVGLAAANQYAASARVVSEEQAVSTFWQQLAWRAPGLRAGAGLAVSYAGASYGEDVDAVNGPANLIYFPQTGGGLPVTYPVYALKQYDWTSKEVLGGGELSPGYRTHTGAIDTHNLLVITQPAETACVRVIDRRWPWYSYNDHDTTLLIGSRSDTTNILTGGPGPRLPASIFGPEPAHGWCYTFAKAELAVQMEDWSTAAALGDAAAGRQEHPVDRIEWMPFLQAYAALGRADAVREVASKLLETRFNQTQACAVLTAMRGRGYAFTPAVQEEIKANFCPTWPQ